MLGWQLPSVAIPPQIRSCDLLSGHKICKELLSTVKNNSKLVKKWCVATPSGVTTKIRNNNSRYDNN